MWSHPGKQLLFMGAELGQWSEWDHDATLEWHLLGHGGHVGVQRLVRRLNEVQADQPALYQRDAEPEGFGWLVPNDAGANTLAFCRWAEADDAGPVVCIANLSPVVRHGYGLTLPRGGTWLEVLNTDAVEYGGSGVGNQGRVEADGLGRVVVTLPPLAVLWLVPEP